MSDKYSAVLDLMYASNTNRRATKAMAERVVKACKVLGLSKQETLRLLGYLEITDRNGNPFLNFQMPHID